MKIKITDVRNTHTITAARALSTAGYAGHSPTVISDVLVGDLRTVEVDRLPYTDYLTYEVVPEDDFLARLGQYAEAVPDLTVRDLYNTLKVLA